MRHKYKLFLFLFTTSFIFLLFSQNVIGIVNENDINFSWISTELYEQENPYDFDIDSSLNITDYNNTDYYQHTESFEPINYTNEYVGNQHVFPVIEEPEGICKKDGFFYIAHENDYVRKYDNFMNEIEIMNNSEYILSNDFIKDITNDGTFFYVLAQTNVYDLNTFIYKYDNFFNYIDTIISLIKTVDGFYLNGLLYLNGSLYCTGRTTGFNDFIKEYDLEGNLLDTIDTDSDYDSGHGISYYKGFFYISSGDLPTSIHYYDDNFNYQGVYITLSRLLLYIYFDYFTELIYTMLYDFVIPNPDVMQIYNIGFQINSNYSKSYGYPEENGLFDAIDNINNSLTIQTNQLSYYLNNATYGTFNGSYSFTNDIIGQNPIGWNVDETGGTVNIILEEDEHTMLVEFDANAATGLNIFQTFTNQISGTIELWVKSNNVNAGVNVIIDGGEDSSNGFQVSFGNDYIRTYTGVYTNHHPVVVDTWYHIRIDFESGAGMYEGLLPDTFHLWVDDTKYSDIGFWVAKAYIGYVKLGSLYANGVLCHIDAIGYSWLDNYTIGENLFDYYSYVESYHHSFIYMNEDYNEIVNIDCIDGIYRVNDINTNYSVFLNINDTWNINILINQINENGTLYIYNESQSLLFSYDFNSSNSGNIKYIKYEQHYQNTTHFIYISNFSIYSNNTFISGNNGFLSYKIDLEETNAWNLEVSSSLTITGNGRYRIYVSNDTYNSNNTILQLSNWITIRNESITLDLSSFTERIINPYLILETINGMYLLDYIRINGSATLYDNRNYFTEGFLLTSNVDTDNSYFYVSNNRLYYQITFDDNNEEYMKLSFDIANIDNQNYQLIYKTYQNCSESSIIKQIKIKNEDASYTNIDIPSYYVSDIEILNQEKTTSQIEFLISDNDLQDNLTISGYFEGFTYNYNEQVSLSLFIDQMLIMLIPIIIILALTFGLSVALKPEKSKDMLNREAFFPIFLISSIIVFVLGFFDTWILFSIIISAILYIIKKRGDKS